MKRTLTLASIIAISAAAFLPLPAAAQTGFNVVINSAPPAPRFESVPAPRNGYVWAPGYWNWDGGRHSWTSGHWERARNGYQYQTSEWVRDNDGYRLRQGGWQPVARSYADGARRAPPPPRYERVPRARDGKVWMPGYWQWNRNRYEWRAGTWLTDRPGHVYSGANWIERDGRWHLEPGYWTARGRDRDRDDMNDRDRDGIPDRVEQRQRERERMEHRDADGDGIVDADDRDRDNDGIRNRDDADRDGDGVDNEHDARPDNPRRN